MLRIIYLVLIVFSCFITCNLACIRFSDSSALPKRVSYGPKTVLNNVPFDVHIGLEAVTPFPTPKNNSWLNEKTSLLILDKGSLIDLHLIQLSNWTQQGDVTIQQYQHIQKIQLKLKSGSHDIEFRLESTQRKDCGLKTKDVHEFAKLHAIPAWFSVLPPLITLVVALFTRHVLLSLFLGIYVGTVFLNNYDPITGMTRTWDHVFPTAVADEDHAIVILFCWLLSGMVAIIAKSGGTAGLAQKVVQYAKSSFSGQLCTWLLGLSMFFDDYTNALITGNTARSITDRLRISREKLAFIVDATAAPIASVAPISSWIGFELSLMKDQFQIIGLQKSVYVALIETIPKRFYSVFLIVFCLTNILSKRDYGPMLAVERRVRKTGTITESSMDDDDEKEKNTRPSEAEVFAAKEGVPCRWYNAVIPIATVVVFAFVATIIDACATIREQGGHDYSVTHIFSVSNSFRVLMWSGFVSYLVPMLMYSYQKILTPRETTEVWIEGMKELMGPIIVLILAWSLGYVVNELRLASWLVTSMEKNIDIRLLPTIIFLLSSFISFCTGSSWSTMTILFPIVVPLVWNAGEEDYDILVNNIASVLAGSVFGDHCSPLSDTTILVSLATKCEVPAHVKTQIPYAATVALISVLLGTLPLGYSKNYSEWIAIPCGSIAIVMIFFILGREVEDYVVCPEDSGDKFNAIENALENPRIFQSPSYRQMSKTP